MGKSINFITLRFRRSNSRYASYKYEPGSKFKLILFTVVLTLFIFFLNFTYSFIQNKWPYVNFRAYYGILVSDNYPLLYENKHSFHHLTMLLAGYNISDKSTILFYEIPLLKHPRIQDNLKDKENIENVPPKNDEDKEVPEPQPGSACEITINPKNTDGYLSCNNILVKNHTKCSPDIHKLLNSPPVVDFQKIKGPKVLIIHTHTCESFLSSAAGRDRSFDQQKNIVHVGEEMAKTLRNLGINTIHDKTVHDHPDFNRSYYASLETIERYLNEYPSISMVLDVHRDSMINSNGVSYKPTTITNGKKSSQVMIVSGTNANGLHHPNWQQNLGFALKWQKLMKDWYPTLARPIDLRSERFNTHTTPASLLLEVGSSANTMEEAINGGICAMRVLAELLK